MANFSIAQKFWWERLVHLIQLQATKTPSTDKQHSTARAMRTLAMEILESQPSADTIEYHDGYRSFDSREAKINYIKAHKKNGTYGEADILFPLLEALGYRMSLVREKNHSKAAAENYGVDSMPLLINVHHIQNDHYEHWRRQEADVPGDGNCMYHTVAAQVILDLRKGIAPIALPAPTSRPKTQTLPARASANARMAAIKKAHKAVSDDIMKACQNILSPSEIQGFKALDEEAMQRQQEAGSKITSLDIEDLIVLYRILQNAATSENDTFLADKPLHHGKEEGRYYLKDAIDKGTIQDDTRKDLEIVLRKSISTEIWRSANSSDIFNHWYKQRPTKDCRTEVDTASHMSSPANCAY